MKPGLVHECSFRGVGRGKTLENETETQQMTSSNLRRQLVYWILHGWQCECGIDLKLVCLQDHFLVRIKVALQFKKTNMRGRSRSATEEVATTMEAA